MKYIVCQRESESERHVDPTKSALTIWANVFGFSLQVSFERRSREIQKRMACVTILNRHSAGSRIQARIRYLERPVVQLPALNWVLRRIWAIWSTCISKCRIRNVHSKPAKHTSPVENSYPVGNTQSNSCSIAEFWRIFPLLASLKDSEGRLIKSWRMKFIRAFGRRTGFIWFIDDLFTKFEICEFKQTAP